jgi:hypothetical protein
MPRATACRKDASLIQLSGNSTHSGEPLGPQVIHNGPQVRRATRCVCPNCCHGLLVADLLAPECPRTIGIAELHTACPCSSQSGLGALADQARFQFGNEAICVSRKRVYGVNRCFYSRGDRGVTC